MLEEDLLTMGHARALLGLESSEEQLRLAEDLVARKLSVRDTEQAVKRIASGPSKKESSTPTQNDANIRAAELKMKRFLGTQVKIHLYQNGGKIEIEFGSMNELDRIYSVILRKSDA
jgi:ParB family chromosome partitioning protein